MKKTLLTLSLLFTMLAMTNAQIVITEIMYNPPESGTDSLEYVELHNNTNAAVDVSGWTFTQGFEFTFPASSTINPNAYIVIAKSASAFQTVFGFAPYGVWVTGGALTNNPGEDIALHNAAGAQIDSVDYKNAAPWPLGANGQGNSLVLCNPNSDNADPANWQDASTSTGVTINGKLIYANPGAASNCATVIIAQPDNYSVAQNVSTNLSVLNNDVLPNPLTALTISSQPTVGDATVNPDNSISYTPPAGYCGADLLVYQICDNGGCDTAVVHIQVQCYPEYSIAEVTTENADGVADSIGVSTALHGIVYGINTRASATGLQFTLINEDNTAGLNVFSPAATLGYTVQEGDEISVSGVIGQFNGLNQISPASITLQSQFNPLSIPPTVVKPDESTESRLIRIQNLHLVDPVEWASGVGPGFSARAVSDDHPQDTVLIRVDNDVVDVFNMPAPIGAFNLIGIGGQFDASIPYSDGYQIAPRYTPDILPVGATKNVDFSANVRLTPNPAHDFVQLKSDLRFDRLQLLSPDGRLIQTLEQPDQDMRISLTELPVGAYFIRFVKDGAAWTTRIVKM